MDPIPVELHNADSATDFSLSYCYICNAQINSSRPEDWEAVWKDDRGKARDYVPVTCDSSDCLSSYDRLLEVCVPYLSAPHLDLVTYDGGPFLEFAVRNKREEMRDQMDLTTGSLISLEYENVNAHRLEPLFQTWFFFGLLHEFLGPMYHMEDFLDDNGRLITTRRLQAILRVWTEDWHASERVKAIGTSHLMACLHYVSRALRVSISNPPLVNSSFDKNLMKVLVFTGEMLETALRQRYPSEHYTTAGFASYLDSDFLTKALELGWCPFEVDQLGKDSLALVHAVFSCELERQQPKLLHSTCTWTECCLRRSDPEKIIKPLHLDEKCTCNEVGLDGSQMGRLFEILSRQQVPVLRLQVENGTVGVLEIVEASADLPYIAISHVWNQGLGNSMANRIPQCQLGQLWKYLDSLRSITSAKCKDQSISLWLDTLCCPVTPEDARNVAIVLMRKTYEEASHVLVLDTELLSLSACHLPVLEVAARISFIQWTRRLWTLQESCLATQLWFKFHDCFINSRSLWLALRDIYRRQDPICAQIATIAISWYQSIRCFDRNYINHLGPAFKLRTLAKGLSSRSVTQPNDEPLCMATLLGLDMEQIVRAPKDERMQRLWQLISQEKLLTRRILFHQCSKLREPGYRWAPSTFLQTASMASFLQIENDPNTATLSLQGLHVRSPGILLHVPALDGSSNIESWNLHDDIGLSLFSISSNRPTGYIPSIISLRDLDGRWMFLFSLNSVSETMGDGNKVQDSESLCKMLTFSGGDYALIQVKPGPLWEANRDGSALLMRVEKSENEIVCAPMVMVSTVLHNATWTRILERATTMADDIRRHLDKEMTHGQVHQVLSDGIESALLQIVHELDEVDRILAASNSWSAEEQMSYLVSASNFQEDLVVIGGRQNFRQVLKYAIAGRYVVVKEYLSENQSWVVS